jgi:hypothetical protein
MPRALTLGIGFIRNYRPSINTWYASGFDIFYLIYEGVVVSYFDPHRFTIFML